MSQALIPSTHTHAQFGDLRVVVISNDTWFVATDLARVLDLRDAANLIRNVRKDYRCTHILSTSAGDKPVSLVNISGLLQAILSSRKPQAKPFQKWVLSDVLPSIAKTGAYVDTDNMMGATLGEATGGAVSVNPEASRVVELLHMLIQLYARLEGVLVDSLDGRFRDLSRTLREQQREHSRQIGQVVRLNKAQRPSNAGLDPNRPLNEEEIERFKFMVATGRSLREVARSLNRTHQAIERFVRENSDLVQAALKRQLL